MTKVVLRPFHALEFRYLSIITWYFEYFNNDTGHIPKEIGYLTHLEELHLAGNSLMSGSLPKEMGNFTALRYSTLNGNNISGMIAFFLKLSMLSIVQTDYTIQTCHINDRS